LFAAEGASARTLVIEIVIASCFLIAAVLGFKRSFWIAPVALAGHGVFDCLRRFFIVNPGVPRWWPGLCLAMMWCLPPGFTVRLRKPSIANWSSVASRQQDPSVVGGRRANSKIPRGVELWNPTLNVAKSAMFRMGHPAR